jgi:hypothetical protein
MHPADAQALLATARDYEAAGDLQRAIATLQTALRLLAGGGRTGGRTVEQPGLCRTRGRKPGTGS